MAAHYVVLIVGGGIAGLSLAYAPAGRCSVALVAAGAERGYRQSPRPARRPGREGAAKAYRFLAGRGFPPDACRAAVGRGRTELSQGD